MQCTDRHIQMPTDPDAPETAESLDAALAVQIERDAFGEARATLFALLRLRPGDPSLLEVQELLDSQLAAAGGVGERLCLRGHRCFVNAVTFTPDGLHVLSASGGVLGECGFSDGTDRSVRLWERLTGRQVRVYEGHSTLVAAMACAPTKPYLASGSRSGTIGLWHRDEGKLLRTFRRQAAVHCLAFSADSTRLLSGSEDRVLRLWDVEGDHRLCRGRGHVGTITGVAFLPDGRQAVTSSQDHTVRVWNLDSGQEIRCLEGHTRPVSGVAVSANGRHAVSGGADNSVRLWDVETGQEVRRFEGHTNVVNAVALSPDGRRCLSGGADLTVRLWETATGRELCQLEGHTGTVKCLAFASDGRAAVSGGADRRVRLWDLPA
jgi:WD40 repeat protein